MPDFVIKSKKRKEYEQFTCRIESELLEKVRLIVLDNNLSSVNEFINECIRFSIDNLKNNGRYRRKMNILGLV